MKVNQLKQLKKWFNEYLDYGTLEDKRDGRTYKTIKIRNQVWMAENLAYSDSIQSPYLKGQSWCYNNDSLNCLKGGRYYSWTAAMDIHYKWLDDSPYLVDGLIGNPHKGICPDGWHIPNNDEWSIMYDAIVKNPYAMQAKGHRLWPDATNNSGFSALPVNRCYGCQYEFGSLASFVSASEINEKYAYIWHLQMSQGNFSTGYQADHSKKYAYSIRCIKDSD